MTMIELANRLNEEGFNNIFYCIGPKWPGLGDAYALDKVGDQFEWFYVERGQRREAERTFASEDEACQFAYEALSKDRWTQSHMLGMYKSEPEAKDLADKLSAQGIASDIDRIPYGGLNDPRFRVFVYGKDFFKAKQYLGY